MKDSDKAVSWPPLGMSVAECAEVLRVDRKAVLTAIAERGLPAVKIGRGFRIDYEALRAWLVQGEGNGHIGNTYHLCFAFINDKAKNTLEFYDKGDVGGALEVSVDPRDSLCMLTFWDEDGNRRQAKFEEVEPSDLSPEELGREAARLGYYVEPECEPYVGMYILGRLDSIWGEFFATHESRRAKNAGGSAAHGDKAEAD